MNLSAPRNEGADTYEKVGKNLPVELRDRADGNVLSAILAVPSDTGTHGIQCRQITAPFKKKWGGGLWDIGYLICIADLKGDVKGFQNEFNII